MKRRREERGEMSGGEEREDLIRPEEEGSGGVRGVSQWSR